jgi:hypothetical protein
VSDITAAFLIWLPTGTLLPFFVSRLTGAGWRGAFIEASIFACLGLLIYPTMFALLIAPFITLSSADPLFIAGYLLAFLTLLLFRRKSRGRTRYRR